MTASHKRHGSHADFHQVSIAVAPERDTPAFLQSYALGLGLTPEDHWWFLTGDQKQLWRSVDEDLKLAPAKPIPAEERLNPWTLLRRRSSAHRAASIAKAACAATTPSFTPSEDRSTHVRTPATRHPNAARQPESIACVPPPFYENQTCLARVSLGQSVVHASCRRQAPAYLSGRNRWRRLLCLF